MGTLAVRDTKISETFILETMHILVEETGWTEFNHKMDIHLKMEIQSNIG